MNSKFVIGSMALASSFAIAGNVTWNGDTGGNWSNGANWDSGVAPVNGDVAILPDVSSGIREVTIDTASEATRLTVEQTTSGAATAITLNDDLTLYSADWDGSPTWITPTAGKASISFNLNGHTFTLRDNNGRRMAAKIDGTWNIGSGSLLELVQTGAGSGLQLTNDGVIDQHDGGEIFYHYDSGFNTGGNRNYVNNGVWTMSNAAYFRFLGPNGHRSPGGFGYLTGCENRGSFSILSNSTNEFGTLTNYGEMLIGNGAYLGAPGCSPEFYTAEGGVTEVAGEGVIFGSDNVNGWATLGNGGEFTIGNGVATNNLTMSNGSVRFQNYEGGVFTIPSNAVFTAHYIGPQGNCVLENAGELHIDGGTLQTDWTPSSNNNGDRHISNSGLMRIDNGGVFQMTSSIGRDIWGFTGNSNSGVLEILNGSMFHFIELANSGAVKLGGDASLGGKRLSNHWILNNNSGDVIVTGTNNVIGNLLLENTGCHTTLNSQRSIDHYEYETNVVEDIIGGTNIEEVVEIPFYNKGATVVIGTNDEDVAELILASPQHAYYNANVGTTTELARASSLLLTARCSNQTTQGNTVLTNSGYFRHGGRITIQPNFNGWRNIENYGEWVVDGTNAVYEQIAATGGQSPGEFYYNNYAGGSFGGEGVFCGLDSTGVSWFSGTLTFNNSGELRPTGELEIQNANITSTGGASMTVVATSGDKIGALKLTGKGANFALPASGATLNVELPKKLSSIGGTHKVRIVEANSVSGTFDSFTINGEDPALSKATCFVEYGPNYIDLTIKVPTGTVIFVR